MTNTTPTIEKYELEICAIINKITNIEKTIENKKKIGHFAKRNPERIMDAVLKLQNAKIELHNAIEMLLEAGNKK